MKVKNYPFFRIDISSYHRIITFSLARRKFENCKQEWDWVFRTTVMLWFAHFCSISHNTWVQTVIYRLCVNSTISKRFLFIVWCNYVVIIPSKYWKCFSEPCWNFSGFSYKLDCVICKPMNRKHITKRWAICKTVAGYLSFDSHLCWCCVSHTVFRFHTPYSFIVFAH